MKKNTFQLYKRWFNIIFGRSTAAVEQGVGKCYKKDEVRGYYNDLTNKVNSGTLLDEEGIPYNIVSSGEKVYSLVTIAQYALGCYDLYLLKNDLTMLHKFMKLAEYLLVHQEENGKWDARASLGSTRGNSSCMAQGQGCSIMIRAYLYSKDVRYFESAEKAIDFMLLPIEIGGTTIQTNKGISLEKYPPENGKVSSVLNGWIFGLFGLYDYYLVTNSQKIKEIFDTSCKTLTNKIMEYDCGYWSKYDLLGTMASPAYHSLHIALLHVLADLSEIQILDVYSERFSKYYANLICKIRAVMYKVVQKVKADEEIFIVQ